MDQDEISEPLFQCGAIVRYGKPEGCLMRVTTHLLDLEHVEWNYLGRRQDDGTLIGPVRQRDLCAHAQVA